MKDAPLSEMLRQANIKTENQLTKEFNIHYRACIG